MTHKRTIDDLPVEESKVAPLTNKGYARELKQLHVELVKLQRWVVHKGKGLRVRIVFEGRDGAGKGGTFKAITERAGPRVFLTRPCLPKKSNCPSAGSVDTRPPTIPSSTFPSICRPGATG